MKSWSDTLRESYNNAAYMLEKGFAKIYTPEMIIDKEKIQDLIFFDDIPKDLKSERVKRIAANQGTSEWYIVIENRGREWITDTENLFDATICLVDDLEAAKTHLKKFKILDEN